MDCFSLEDLGNMLLFLPFGILYPLAKRDASWKRTIDTGALFSIIVEIFQPVIGRSFVINDIILNIFGTASSAAVFYLIRGAVRKRWH
ncbi:MAG: VanZ family protein [Oscillospiraceae bacterium]